MNIGKPLKNPRHELFARKYVELGIGRWAYHLAGYSAAMPDNPRQCSPADACASRLLKHVKVNHRIEGLRQAMAKRADVTEESILDELEQARTLALQCEQTASAVSATVAKAKLVGLMIDRKEQGKPGDFDSWTEAELRAYVLGNAAATGIADHGDDSEQQPIEPTHNGPSTAQ